MEGELNMKNKISVIVPVYNTSRYLERCISFLTNQTEKNIEIILVDDYSTDESVEKIEKIQRRYPHKIKFYQNQENMGVGATRNVGLDVASGEFVSFIDSDDWIDSSAYSNALDALCAEHADIAILGVKDECDSYQYNKIRYSYAYNTISNDFALRLLARSDNNDTFISPMVTHKIFRKEYIDKHGLRFPVNTFFEDDEFTFKCFLYDCKIVTVPNVYYHYFQRLDSIMHNFSKEYIDGFILLFKDLRVFLQENKLWLQYNDMYYKYFRKTFYSFLNTLFLNESKISSQKMYFSYFFTKIRDINAEELIEYIDIEGIKRLL